jgi:polysaccharide export outer membrane protein
VITVGWNYVPVMLLACISTCSPLTATAQSPSAPATLLSPPQNQYPSNGSSTVPESTEIMPGDIISVRVFDDVDLDQSHLRVTDAGTIPVLLIGPVKIGGLTPAQASTLVAQGYMNKNILINAHIQVQVESLASSDITVIGSVNGITGTVTGVTFPVNSPRPLLTVLALAGGLNDRASRTVTIQHRDPSAPRVTVTLPVDANEDLNNDPMVYPGDIVVVPRAGIVYILGNVAHAQSVVMNEDGKLSLLEALSQAGSPLPTAGLHRVMVFRKVSGEYKALPINVGKILRGTAPDISLAPQDAVWVPFSYGKNILVNAAQITAAISSSAIYTR